MQKDFNEFLFNLRGSGFFHHSPEGTKRILFQSFRSKYPIADNFQSWVDGEIGSLSDNALIDMRNMIIGMNFMMSSFAIEQNVDSEYAFGVSDYFINKAESIRSSKEFNILLDEMSQLYWNMITEKNRVSYGEQINKCIHYIEQHLYSPIKACDVADYVGLSLPYLTSLFKKETGYSLYKYIKAKKIDEAKEIIKNTGQPLTAIAVALGYSSLSHFSKAFKDATRITPIAYRNGKEHG